MTVELLLIKRDELRICLLRFCRVAMLTRPGRRVEAFEVALIEPDQVRIRLLRQWRRRCRVVRRRRRRMVREGVAIKRDELWVGSLSFHRVAMFTRLAWRRMGLQVALIEPDQVRIRLLRQWRRRGRVARRRRLRMILEVALVEANGINILGWRCRWKRCRPPRRHADHAPLLGCGGVRRRRRRRWRRVSGRHADRITALCGGGCGRRWRR
eukprot:585414-Prymnesium_polylepis.1